MLAYLFGDKVNDPEVGNVVKDIQAMKILVYNGDGDNNKSQEFQNDLKNIEKLSDFKTFISVNEENSYVKMMTKKSDTKEKEEFLILVIEDKQTVMIWVKGHVNLKDMKKLGKVMKGM